MQRVAGPALLSIAIVLSMTLAGCAEMGTGGDGGGGDQGEGQVEFYVKDAPSDDFESVFVTFNEVKVHKAGGSGDDDLTTVADDDLSTVNDDDLTTVEDDDLEGDSGWIVIFTGEESVDLKQFQGDAKAFLGGATIDAGKYTQIRINVTDVYGVLTNGSRVNFTLPGGDLKIVRPWNVTDGESTLLVVDFELDKSISQTGNGEYRMKPVLKLSVDEGNPGASADDAETDANGNQGGNKTKAPNTRANNTHKP